MTNMMNGAVAIYGGVGVMEIRQPLPQAVESVAQAVEDLAVNAHISLRELKSTIAAVIEKKLPKYAQLMEMNPVVAARTVVDGAKLTAYENGYAVYEQDGAHTVMAIDRCGDYRYDFNDGTYEVVPAEVFEDAEWSVRLVMEGERRMESNRNKTVAINEAASLDCDGSDWSDAVMVDFMDEENAEMLAEEELRKLYAAMSKLTERQREIIQLYFYKGMNQYEIAEELGIARPVVSKIMTAAIKKLKKSSSLDLFSLEMFENIAYIMAKHAHPDQVPDTPDEWLENFNTFSIYQILPQLIELWGLNVQTEVEARKNLAKVSG